MDQTELSTCISDEKLILLLKKGDLEALGDLYDRHKQLVFRTSLVITGDQEAASDLCQDVFLRLYRFANRIDEQRPIEPWLYRMTANLAYTWIKKSRRWFKPLEDLAEWLAGPLGNSTYEEVEHKDDWEQVQQAVACLPAAQRVVVVLFYLNDLSLQEISSILEIPVGTVKSRLHYGRRALKKKLGMGESLLEPEKFPDFNYEQS